MKYFFLASTVIIISVILSLLLVLGENYLSHAQSFDIADTCTSQHWDKIIFKITHPKFAQVLKLPVDSELDIKVLDDPIKVLDVKKRVLEFLKVPPKPAYYKLISIVEVEHAITCLSKTPSVAEPTFISIDVPITLNILGFGGRTATESTQPMDIVFAIDSSTSMNENDPDNLRLESASSFIQSLNPSNDQAGVVSWDQGIDLSFGLSSNFDEVLSNINSVDSSGSTDLGVGLQEAVRILDGSSRTDTSKIIVFLSDGNTEVDDSPVNIDNVIEDAANKNYKIYSIGLSYEAGEVDLRKMATATGGEFYSTPSAADLQEVFGNIYTTIIESTSPSNVDLTLTSNVNGSRISIEEDSFSVTPTNVNVMSGGQLLMTWQNISQYVGDGDNSLDSNETFTLSFNVKGVINDKEIGTIINNPVILAEGSEVRYVLPNGSPKVIPIPEISLDSVSGVISRTINLTP